MRGFGMGMRGDRTYRIDRVKPEEQVKHLVAQGANNTLSEIFRFTENFLVTFRQWVMNSLMAGLGCGIWLAKPVIFI